jgi:hypothetical protein
VLLPEQEVLSKFIPLSFFVAGEWHNNPAAPKRRRTNSCRLKNQLNYLKSFTTSTLIRSVRFASSQAVLKISLAMDVVFSKSILSIVSVGLW